MPQIKYKDKWHNVKEIEKCDDGVTYQVEGVDGKVYSKDVSDFRLSKEETHEIINPDGSITRGPGKEPLRKPLKKSLMDRWELIKAAINHENAFMDMVGDQKTADKQEEAAEGSIGKDKTSDDTKQTADSETLDSQIQDPDQEDDSDAVQQRLRPDIMDEGNADDTDAEKTVTEEESDQPESYDEEKLIDLLREEGYSNSEIAHIVHGHVPGSQSPDSIAANQDQRREEEKHSHKMDRMKSETEIQTDHAKRMADLEYEHAKKEKELRIKHLEEELKTKLEHLKNKGKQDGKVD